MLNNNYTHKVTQYQSLDIGISFPDLRETYLNEAPVIWSSFEGKYFQKLWELNQSFTQT